MHALTETLPVEAATLTGGLVVLTVALDVRPDFPLLDEITSLRVSEAYLPPRAKDNLGLERPWAWAGARLLAERQVDVQETSLRFGCSVGTLLEGGDAPDHVPAGTCASLWRVGDGMVLCLELLADGLTSEFVRELADGLREDLIDKTIRAASASPMGGRFPAGADVGVWETPGRAAIPDGLTLTEIFGETLPAELASCSSKRIDSLVVKSALATRGHRHVEGMVIGLLAGARDEVDALVDGELDVDYVQTLGRAWRWDFDELVSEPVTKGSRIAVREDARAALIDLDAMSVHHDYLGYGGEGIVLSTLSLLAQRAAEAQDFWETVGLLTLGPPQKLRDAEARLERLMSVRRRLAEREILSNVGRPPERFRSWTHDDQLRTVLDQRDKQKDLVGGKLESVIGSAHDLLEDQVGKLRLAQRRTWEKLVYAGAIVAGVIGISGVFGTIAAIPLKERFVEPLARGASATMAGTLLVFLLAVVLLSLSARPAPSRPRAEWLAVTGSVLLFIALIAATVGAFAPNVGVQMLIAAGIATLLGCAVLFFALDLP